MMKHRLEATKRMIAAVGVGALIAVGGSALVASPAQALPFEQYVKNDYEWGAWARSCPLTSCEGVYLRNNTGLSMECWVDSEEATGNYTSTRWFRVLDDQTWNTHWMHSSLVANQSVVGHC